MAVLRRHSRLLTVGLAAIVFQFYWSFSSDWSGYDLRAYWGLDGAQPYAVHVARAYGAFLYSPPLVGVLDPLGAIPFDLLRGLWLAAQVALLAWMLGPLVITAVVLPPLLFELVVGNISIFMAAAILLGLRGRSWAWVMPILAKVTPAVGLAWFVGRRDWRGLGIALGVLGAIVGISIVVNPCLWREWLRVLDDNQSIGGEYDLGPLPVRLLLATVACYWAGRTNRPWLVPIAVALSLGQVWTASLSVAVAAWPLRHAAAPVLRGQRRPAPARALGAP